MFRPLIAFFLAKTFARSPARPLNATPSARRFRPGVESLGDRVVPATLALWNFNSATPDGNVATGRLTPSAGAGTLTAVGGVGTSFVSGAGSTDPATTDDSALNLTMFPAQGTANRTAGVQLAVNTAGFGSVVLRFDQKNTPQGSGRQVVQVSLGGGGPWIDVATLTATAPNAWLNTRTVNLSGVAGVANNPNLRVRVVAAFNGATYPGTGGGYSPVGAWALDAIRIDATALPVVTVEEVPADSEEGPVERLRLTRVGDLSQPLTVGFAIDPNGSPAVAGQDYTLQGAGVTFAADPLTGTVTFAAGSATADVYAVPAATGTPPVLLALRAGVGYVLGAAASVPVNLVLAPPSATVDFAGIRTDVAYKVDLAVVVPQGRFGLEVTVPLGTVTVKAGSTPQDLRDKLYGLLDDAGYQVVPLGDNRMRIKSVRGAAIYTIDLKFYDGTDANGQPVPPKDLKGPTLFDSDGIPVDYNGTRLKKPNND